MSRGRAKGQHGANLRPLDHSQLLIRTLPTILFGVLCRRNVSPECLYDSRKLGPLRRREVEATDLPAVLPIHLHHGQPVPSPFVVELEEPAAEERSLEDRLAHCGLSIAA
jgi:hypothetical protein